ncbi:hypothetical protein NG798_23940 [Ancylothrix sp. C2]|nr:hypothetical protein [Ancylothrix sp. D3o]
MKFVKSWWPVWFPYPTAWLEAFIVGLMMMPLGASLQSSGRLGVGVATISANLGPLFLLILLGFVTPFIGFAYVHSFLWGNRPPKWHKNLPAPRSILEAFYALSVTTISSLVCLTVLLFLIDVRRNYYTQSEMEFLAGIGSFVWLVCGAYLYQVKRLVWLGIEGEKRVKKSLDKKVDDSPFKDFNF